MRVVQALLERLRSAGAKPAHERRALSNALAGRPLDARRARGDAAFPRGLELALPAAQRALESLATIESAHPGLDGSERLLVRLADGRSVETVRLPSLSLCASTQVGCAVGCTFCMTGREGLARNLAADEILAQVMLARRRGPVKRVVFMGMGEPAHNLAAVLAAVDALVEWGGLGRKDLVISSVGDRRLFARLAEHPVKPALALSLHTLDAARRRELLPRAPAIDPEELVELAQEQARASGIPTQVQWTLLAGVNDGDDELARIERVLAGRWAVLNFIPWNAVDGVAYERPSAERLRAIGTRLGAAGVFVKFRRSAGQDVDGACGQLRARRAVC
ncbi:MAG: RNA methyltransferase [Planctomycetes bacterium]|nr:RNA methyltransferase [Planctomycetota bacterium]